MVRHTEEKGPISLRDQFLMKILERNHCIGDVFAVSKRAWDDKNFIQKMDMDPRRFLRQFTNDEDTVERICQEYDAFTVLSPPLATPTKTPSTASTLRRVPLSTSPASTLVNSRNKSGTRTAHSNLGQSLASKQSENQLRRANKVIEDRDREIYKLKSNAISQKEQSVLDARKIKDLSESTAYYRTQFCASEKKRLCERRTSANEINKCKDCMKHYLVYKEKYHSIVRDFPSLRGVYEEKR